MKDGSFQFKPGKRTMIPKADGISTRPLTIAPPRDKIVQEVMRMILETIFEPTFLDNSHGFRPNRGCHTALRKIKTQFGAASFLIEGDISKCFDSFDHVILVNLLSKKISDQRFIQLI
jgi:retron-type reverse transcriptase